jgi:hypothetical protein
MTMCFVKVSLIRIRAMVLKNFLKRGNVVWLGLTVLMSVAVVLDACWPEEFDAPAQHAQHRPMLEENPVSPIPRQTPAESDPLEDLRRYYDDLVRKEDFSRRITFTVLLPYLPSGTQMSSGYRSPREQLGVIYELARRFNAARPSDAIPLPHRSQMRVDNPDSWLPTLMGLRARGYIVNAPTATPHAMDRAVFDMSGADLAAIEAGCRQAERDGLIKFRQILREPVNNAVHVDVLSIDPRALQRLVTTATPADPSFIDPTTLTGENQKQQILQELQEKHDRESDPGKKIDYDRQIGLFLDPATEVEKVEALWEEILQHELEMKLRPMKQRAGETR